jgi:ADP-ribose pyrophosphatase YjhB (NUDIX family)
MATIGVFAVIIAEDGRVLCVKQNYPPFQWTLPGGRVEAHESPLAALHREVLEETGRRIVIERFIGVYARPHEDDLALAFAARVVEETGWRPDSEIAALDFFPPGELPESMNPRHRLRVADAIAGHAGVVRVFAADGGLQVSLPSI